MQRLLDAPRVRLTFTGAALIPRRLAHKVAGSALVMLALLLAFTVSHAQAASTAFETSTALETSTQWQLQSPDQQVQVTLTLDEAGLRYAVNYRQQAILRPSLLGLQLQGQPPLQGQLQGQASRRSSDSSWSTVWGQRAQIRDHFNELTLQLHERTKAARQLTVLFRAYNDGVAFRYLLPAQPALSQPWQLERELTEFNFAQNFKAWWLPVRSLSYEYPYQMSALSGIDNAHTPLLLLGRDVAVSIHEADLTDYAAMTIQATNDNTLAFRADLIRWNGQTADPVASGNSAPSGNSAHSSVAVKGPALSGTQQFQSPWRTISLGQNEVALLNSDLILNLNDPLPEGTDTSYIKPGKYIGIWWEMHIGNKDWSPGPIQGATTARAKQYIDFAAKHGIDSVLIEGWNQGWEGQWWQRPPTFSFTKPVQGFAFDEVLAYAKARGVALISHHETAAGVSYYEARMNEAYQFLQDRGIHSIKTGYVGKKLDADLNKDGTGEWHDGQFMVQHQQHVVELAAKHQLMVNAHETVKDTGLSRTYPNMMSRESVRGMEYNGGSPDTGNAPDHTVIIPFTRGLAGPIDFTPGIFNFAYQKHRPFNRVPSTLANQLALYITLYSPLQMAADLPENYENHPAFAFIQQVPTDWAQSQALQGKVGEYLVVARQDRHSSTWYLGATSNEQARELNVPLDFLSPNQGYQLTIYQDAADADWQTNPAAYQIVKRSARRGDVLTLKLAPGGGAAVVLTPKP